MTSVRTYAVPYVSFFLLNFFKKFFLSRLVTSVQLQLLRVLRLLQRIREEAPGGGALAHLIPPMVLAALSALLGTVFFVCFL